MKLNTQFNYEGSISIVSFKIVYFTFCICCKGFFHYEIQKKDEQRSAILYKTRKKNFLDNRYIKILKNKYNNLKIDLH